MTLTDNLTSTADLTRAGPREWLGLAALALPTLLVAIDMTVLHLAVPTITVALRPSAAQMLWIVDIYGFMIAGLLVTMGTLGDRIGRRRLLMIGSAGFAAASILAAFAPNAEMLILTRALLGITAATLMPSTLSLLSTMFRNEAERAFAIAIWSSMFMAGAAIGPLFGGFLLEHFWWGSVFLANVPLVAILLLAAPMLLPEYRAERAGRIDLVSIVLSLTGILSLIYGIKQIATIGAGLTAWITIAAGIVLVTAFARRQQTLSEPMFDFSLFRRVTFTTALAIQLLAIFAVSAPYFLGAQYLQLVLDLSPLNAGIWLLPPTLVGIVAAIAASKLSARVPPAYVMALSLVIGALGFGLLMTISGADGLVPLVAGLSLMAIGSGGTTTLSVHLIISAAPPERAGEASGLSETSGEFGMALGIAVTGSLAMATYRAHINAQPPDDLPYTLLTAAQDSLGAFSAVLARYAETPVEAITRVQDAFVSGLGVAALTGLLLMLSLAVLSILVLRKLR